MPFVQVLHPWIILLLIATGGAECELCKFLVERIQQYLKQNGTKEELETFLKKLCDEFPDTVTAQVT